MGDGSAKRGSLGTAGHRPPPSGGVKGVSPPNGPPIVGYYSHGGSGHVLPEFGTDGNRLVVECLDGEGKTYVGGRLERKIDGSYVKPEPGWHHGNWTFDGKSEFPKKKDTTEYPVAVRILAQVFVETGDAVPTRTVLIDSSTLPLPSPIVVPGSFQFIDDAGTMRLRMGLRWWDEDAVDLITAPSPTWVPDASRAYVAFRAMDGTPIKDVHVNLLGSPWTSGTDVFCKTQEIALPYGADLAHVTVVLVLDAKKATFIGRYHALHGEQAVPIASGDDMNRRARDAEEG